METLWTTILNYALYVAVGMAGMFVHFLKLDFKGETASDALNYFSHNFKYTAVATIMTIMGVVGVIQLNQGIMAAFLAGYTFDSMFNKDSGQGAPKP